MLLHSTNTWVYLFLTFPPLGASIFHFNIYINNVYDCIRYEALKYVNFPTQTLGKCGKMFPVMIVGTLFSGKKYSIKDYSIAVSITLGCVMFLLTGVCLRRFLFVIALIILNRTFHQRIPATLLSDCYLWPLTCFLTDSPPLLKRKCSRDTPCPLTTK